MRTAQDSDDTAGFTAGADIYAGYVLSATGEGHNNYGTMVQRFPDKIYVAICTRFNAVGQVLDFEASTTGWDYDQLVAWVVRMRAAGGDPTVYVQLSRWAAAKSAFDQRKIDQPHWWVAEWTNTPHLIDGSVATQWGGASGVDYNQVADYWPGIDPKPTPPPMEDDDMYGLPHVMVKASAPSNALLLYPSGFVQPVMDTTGTAYEQAGCPVILAGDLQFEATLERAKNPQ